MRTIEWYFENLEIIIRFREFEALNTQLRPLTHLKRIHLLRDIKSMFRILLDYIHCLMG